MSRSISRVLRLLLALTVLGGGLVLGTAGTAGASTLEPTASWTETYPIQFGDNGVEIGTATVSRYDADVEDTIVVEYTIPGGYQESHLCVSSTPFTQRMAPGQCEYSNLDPEGESGSYTLKVGPAEVVYLQLHIATQGETAYMGWLPGSPFYGNIKVPNVVTCPGTQDVVMDETDLNDDDIADQCQEFCPGTTTLVETMVDGDCGSDETVYCDSDSDVVDDGVDGNGDEISDVCQDFCPGEGGEVMVDGDCGSDETVYCDSDSDVVDDGVDGNGDEISDVCQDFCPGTDVLVEDMLNGDCDPFVPVMGPTACPAGTVMSDSGNCVAVLPDSGVEPTAPTPATPAQPATPGESATPATPAAPAEPVASVLPSTATPTGVPAIAEAAPAQANADVLGAQMTRAPLAATGSSSSALAALGALLLLLGASATMAGRRTARI